ncbi:nucleotidyltransferase [Roseobacter cerasinus]|uniref:Nucleotidyltransferase n=1 Tax=Roseobacter cerasinus TaxID=2602289 RepID=A0A640VP14_9RHOB|nr:nucleotidyltransferase family protein [Roseobacter cerasinus]GFE49374.1 nucleotidyltransferase [Roseobacter cerasinus]
MRDLPQSLMLFAAGFGTRMRPLTDDRPKPMIEVAGRPLIDHALERITGIAPDRVVANLHYKPAALEAHLRARGVTTLLEMPDILDTGGGLRNALPLLGDGPVFTMNPDVIWRGPNPLDVLRAAWDPTRMDALLICVPVAQTHCYDGAGDFALGEAGTLRRGAGHVYGGTQIIKTNRLQDIDEAAFSLNRIWDLMGQDRRLFGVPYPGKWCDVGQPAGIAKAEALLARRDV